MNKPLKILFKYPSRGRIDRFFSSLDSIVLNLQDTENYHISCTLDEDDVMNTPEIINRINGYKNTSIEWGASTSKIHAINRSMPNYDFDIVCNHADDMVWQFYGFDNFIRAEFAKYGLDTLLHIPDQDAKDVLATMYIAGKEYYNRLGYIYNPIYENLFCDDEAQAIAKHLGCYKYSQLANGLLLHLNPAYGHIPKDEMFERQQAVGWTKDMQTYQQRKSINFGL